MQLIHLKKNLTADKFLQQEPIIQQLKRIANGETIQPNSKLADWLDIHFKALPITTREIEGLFGRLARLKQRFTAAKITFLSAELFRGYTTLRSTREELIKYIKLIRKEKIKLTEFDQALIDVALKEVEEEEEEVYEEEEEEEEEYLDLMDDKFVEEEIKKNQKEYLMKLNIIQKDLYIVK